MAREDVFQQLKREVRFEALPGSLLVTRITEYLIPEKARKLLAAMAGARGGSEMEELRWQMAGLYDRPRARRDEELRGLMMGLETFEEEHVELRLERFCLEAENGFASAAWVLEAALSRWGWLIEDAVTHVTEDEVQTTLPMSAKDLSELLAPWRAQLNEEGLDLFDRAVACAHGLDGSGCRGYVEKARATLAPFVDDPAHHQETCLCLACRPSRMGDETVSSTFVIEARESDSKKP